MLHSLSNMDDITIVVRCESNKEDFHFPRAGGVECVASQFDKARELDI